MRLALPVLLSLALPGLAGAQQLSADAALRSELIRGVELNGCVSRHRELLG